jgi:hypothetical protein
MGLLLSGICRSVRTQTKHPKPGDTWEAFESTQITMVDYGSTHYVEVVGEELRNNMPTAGEECVIDCSISMYVGKTGQPGYGLKGWRRAESSLGSATGVRAVKTA